MDSFWKYKNFNMVAELDIAGEFIYNGVHEIFRISHFTNDGPTFSALYDTAVGIERLQKIVYVLWGMDTYDDDKDFEKSLITHSHTGMRDKINQLIEAQGVKVCFSSRENSFFTILDAFYNHARYLRFCINGDSNKEMKLLREFARSNNLIDKERDFEPDRYLFVTDKLKEILGRTIGGIAHKYYELVKKGSHRNTTFTYELRSGSKAERVFLGDNKKNSLMQAQIDESIALKELLIFFRKTRCKDAFIKFTDEIEPLDFDPGLLVEYFETISKGEIPQMLVDDVEYLYEEKGYSRDRINLIDAFANSYILYDYPIIEEAWKVMENITRDEKISERDVNILQQCKDYIYEDEITDVIDSVITIIEEYRNKNISASVMCNDIKSIMEKNKFFVPIENQQEESE